VRFCAPRVRPAFSLRIDLETNMASYNELIVSARDAETLAAVVGDRRRTERFEAEAADALASVLMDAQMVPHERLPEDRVAMNALVAYREEPDGQRRSVAVVHPSDADPADGRISVLSPVGRALLGRKAGALASIDVPGGRPLTIRVLEVERARSLEEA
jgi:regulator of nucleoside diphosphate kinase